MATTEELIHQLRYYNYRNYDRAHFVYSLSDAELTEALGNATTWNQAWVRVLALSRRSGHSEPAQPRSPSTQKMTTAEFRRRLVPQPVLAPGERLKCWELAIEAFGVTGKRTGKGAYEEVILRKMIEDKEWRYERVPTLELAPQGVTPTLAVFLKAHLTGDWLIFTRTHCLAIRDGKIYDRDSGSTVKKVVTSAYRIRSVKLTPVLEPCDCANPTVFGHDPRCRVGYPDTYHLRWRPYGY